jgi:hypothetical protein
VPVSKVRLVFLAQYVSGANLHQIAVSAALLQLFSCAIATVLAFASAIEYAQANSKTDGQLGRVPHAKHAVAFPQKEGSPGYG